MQAVVQDAVRRHGRRPAAGRDRPARAGRRRGAGAGGARPASTAASGTSWPASPTRPGWRSACARRRTACAARSSPARVEAVGDGRDRGAARGRGLRRRRGLVRRVRARARGEGRARAGGHAPRPGGGRARVGVHRAAGGAGPRPREAGQRVLVIGASGGVGSFAVQIAKAFGAEVTGVASTGKLDLVRSLGADHVVDYTTADVTGGGARYDVVLDIGGNTAGAAAPAGPHPARHAGDRRRRGRGPLAGHGPSAAGGRAVAVRRPEARLLRQPRRTRRTSPSSPG